MASEHKIKRSRLKERIHEIIFEADTPEGKFFDVALMVFIIASVISVIMETTPGYGRDHKEFFYGLEWVFTIFFTIEYVLRIYSTYRPWKYITSFYGIIDFLAIIPTYLSLLIIGAESFAVIRALRLLRVFRIFKMVPFLKQGEVISDALKASKEKILVFLLFIFLMVCIFGASMYFIEGGVNPAFDSIPRSMYWAVVTLTTVGYGDISPMTSIGQFMAAIIMVMGYGVIAVPTGIVSAHMVTTSKPTATNTQTCMYCSKEGHDDDAKYCKHCGEELNHP